MAQKAKERVLVQVVLMRETWVNVPQGTTAILRDRQSPAKEEAISSILRAKEKRGAEWSEDEWVATAILDEAGDVLYEIN